MSTISVNSLVKLCLPFPDIISLLVVSELQSDSKEVKDSGKSLFKETWEVGDKKKKTFDFIVSWTSRELN